MDREAGKPMQPDAMFRICSMTKPTTSVAVMMLYEEERFLLDDPISKSLLPDEFPKSAGKAGYGRAIFNSRYERNYHSGPASAYLQELLITGIMTWARCTKAPACDMSCDVASADSVKLAGVPLSYQGIVLNTA